MSRACTHITDDRYIALRVPDPKAPGSRLAVECERGDLAIVSEQETLPERAMLPNAQRIENKERIWLTAEDVRWLHSVLGEMIEWQDRSKP
jgi:hypothetical protein